MSIQKKTTINTLYTKLVSIIIIALGVALLAGGAYLIALGGSPYFAVAGVLLSVAGILLLKNKRSGVWVFIATVFLTVIWAIADSGFAFWALFSRLYVLALLAALVLLLPLSQTTSRVLRIPVNRFVAITILAGCLFTFIAMFQKHGVIRNDFAMSETTHAESNSGTANSHNWSHWGNTPAGTRFSSSNQITPDNVHNLKQAWTYQTGEVPDPTAGEGFVVTPLYVDGLVYGCTQSNTLFALDGDSGEEIWKVETHSQGNNRPRCRGVGYYETASTAVNNGQVQDNTPLQCRQRIITTTVDARLIAVDAKTGAYCNGFGKDGVVSLKAGMGEIKPGFYFPTAAPTIAGDLIIVGGLVWDNHETGEPSGVVRAFDVNNGKLIWVWDVGNPALALSDVTNTSYTRGTPNVWSTPSYDEELGLVYLPTGNATPDFWGGHRTPQDEAYSSSIVALELATGKERWRYQTVHHDIWDFDVPSQPALFDIPDGAGETIPALIQTTKMGQIFVLNRETGEPVTEVVEKKVPTGSVDDDWTSPTQPYSVGMPLIGNGKIEESDMWGLTLLDQLSCRIQFKKLRYEGDYTPPSEVPTLHLPGWFGGMNWGSVSVVENQNLLIVNDIRVGVTSQLIPRKTFEEMYAGVGSEGVSGQQLGTPWGIKQGQFISALGIPCQQPPFGTLTAIDMTTKDIVWQVPLGTVEDTGPLGIVTHLPIPIGMPTRGGPISTETGVIFMAGTQDFYLRAIDVLTGKELWKGRLPVGAETTPMTYTSKQTGKQFVLISAGGTSASGKPGDYVIAYSL
ncbi:membrane-bound PQQ-dependent dehydrogenase, glucose/quinate/shikimate family [Alteromonas sp. NFXS44]|uniref:membrane-bound PQQ-dependent dehydrogenase, glucose/quinate/shikimate family n=1 Tax=Alteromonas sp. NFXS44 TaxID=2818435 RepID=UPI0032DE4055